MSYTYRCGGVKGGKRHQVTYKKPIEQYRKEPKCHCGGKLHRYRRDEVRDKQRTCYCDGYPYFHRSGTQPWCKDSKREPTQEEYEDRYGPC